MSIEDIRLMNFVIVAVAGAWMFIRVNDSLAQHKWPTRLLYVAIVGFYTTVAAGSLESFYRAAPMTISAWVLFLFATLTILGLFFTRPSRSQPQGESDGPVRQPS